MSYNIDTWKTKELEDFKVPLAAFFEHERNDWHPDRINNDDGSVTLMGGCETCEIKGLLHGDVLHVSDIDISGEGSGTYTNWILEPAFAQSTGTLVAACVWEGGDTINRLIVRDGNVQWEDIEL